MTTESSPYSHPDAPVRHSYPLAIEQPGLSAAISLVARTLPYAVARFGILLAFSVVTIIWFVVTVGGASVLAAKIHPWIGIGWLVIGFGAYGYAWWFVVRYALYLIMAGHVAVMTELVTKGQIGAGSEGMFVYGKRIVTERFGQVNILFALDLLIKGVVHAFNRTLNFITGLIPIPGLNSIMGLVNAIIRAATTYIDETIFSYNLARGDDNAWRSSKDALIYYGQNCKELLKTAIWVVILDKVLTAVVWLVMLAPAVLVGAVLPESAKGAGILVTIVIAALFASNIRQAFLKPVFLVMIMTKFHILVRNQAINLQWDDTLSRASRKFQEIKDKAAAGWSAPTPAPSGPLPSA